MQILCHSKGTAGSCGVHTALPSISFGPGIHSPYEPWFPNMVIILQGTRGAAGTMVGEASRDPDISMVLRAKEAAEKPDVDMQKAQSLETR